MAMRKIEEKTLIRSGKKYSYQWLIFVGKKNLNYNMKGEVISYQLEH